MSARKIVHITSGPAGKNTTITLDGEPVLGAREFVLRADADGVTELTITYVNVEAHVDALIETWGFGSETKTYKAPIAMQIPDEDIGVVPLSCGPHCTSTTGPTPNISVHGTDCTDVHDPTFPIIQCTFPKMPPAPIVNVTAPECFRHVSDDGEADRWCHGPACRCEVAK